MYHVQHTFLSPLAEMQHVDPWNVKGGEDGTIDYNKLVEQVHTLHAHYIVVCRTQFLAYTLTLLRRQ